MGVDVYLKWDGMNEDEEKAQFTGFAINAVGVGYLRESYGGRELATAVLIPEGWEGGSFQEGYMYRRGIDEIVLDGPASILCAMWTDGSVSIPASVLVARLPETLAACGRRYEGEGHNLIEQVKNTFSQFVAMYAKLEKEGKRPRIYVSH